MGCSVSARPFSGPDQPPFHHPHVSNPPLQRTPQVPRRHNGDSGGLGEYRPRPPRGHLHGHPRPRGSDPVRLPHRGKRRRHRPEPQPSLRGCCAGDRPRRPPSRGRGQKHPQQRHRHGRDRDGRDRADDPQQSRRPPLPARQGAQQRGPADETPLPRPAPSPHVAQPAPAPPHHQGDPRPPRRGRLHRDRDAHPLEVDARRRPRLPRALAPQPRQVLRPAPGPAAIQADDDGGRIGKILPDCPLFPRRGSPRRPPARVHPG